MLGVEASELTNETLEARASKYIMSAETAVRSLRTKIEEAQRKKVVNIEALLDAAERYIEDAKYYAAKGDLETALAAASYAEGLIDSLKYLGVIEPEWPQGSEIEKRVFVGGTFELLHPGHIELFRYASSHGKLYVVVARDKTVRRVKGRNPVLDERARLEVVSSVKYVYRAFLGSESDFLESVERVKPDVIVLGPDQMFDEEDLRRSIRERLGYAPKVIRFPEKREFQEGLRGVRDIVRRVCREHCGREKGSATQ